MEILIKKKKDMWNYVHEIKHYLFMPKNRNELRYVTPPPPPRISYVVDTRILSRIWQMILNNGM